MIDRIADGRTDLVFDYLGKGISQHPRIAMARLSSNGVRTMAM